MRIQLLVITVLPSELASTDQNAKASLGGFEPPTFRLTAECANRLRHRDCVRKIDNYETIDIFLEYNIFSIFDIFYALVSPSDKKVQYENY